MKNHKLKYQASRRIAALKKMCAMVLAWVCKMVCKDTPVLMANNNYNISFGNTAKAMAVAASMPIVAVPIQEVQLLDYAVAHETVNATYGMTASTDDDIYLGLIDKDPYTSDQQRERDEYQLDDENWNEVVFEEVHGGSIAKLALHNDWIEKQSYKENAILNLNLPEMGITGLFEITSIKHILPQKKPVDEDETDDYSYKPVTGLFIHEASDVWRIKFDNGEELGVTHKHPIYSTTKGDWELAGELEIGEEVLTKGGGAKVVSKEIDLVQEVYNLEVKDYHNFLVNASGIVVHNTGCFNATKELLKDYITHFKVGGKKGIGNKSIGVRKGNDVDGYKIEVTINSTGEKFDVPINGKEFPDLTDYTPRSNNGTPLAKEFSDLKGNANRNFDNQSANDWLESSGFLDEFDEVYFPNKTGNSNTSSWVRLKKGNKNLEYTWHHHEDGKTMMLVEQRIHSAVNHTGGAALIDKKAVTEIAGYSDIFKSPVFN